MSILFSNSFSYLIGAGDFVVLNPNVSLVGCQFSWVQKMELKGFPSHA